MAGGPVYVAFAARPGFGGLPADFAAGLVLPDPHGHWKDVTMGSTLDFATGSGVGKVRLRGRASLPYGCDGFEQDLVVFDVIAPDGKATGPAIEALGDVFWLFPSDGTELLPVPLETDTSDDAVTSTTRYATTEVRKTKRHQGVLTVTNTRTKPVVSAAFPFEKHLMDGAEDTPIDVTNSDGDVAVPVLVAAFTRGDEKLLGFFQHSWEGTHYQLYDLPASGAPTQKGSFYRYRCAF